MRFSWFRRIGFLFVPKSFVGIIILLACIGYLVFSFLRIDGKSHSASDTLMNFAFFVFIVAIPYLLIGYFTSKPHPTNE